MLDLPARVDYKELLGKLGIEWIKTQEDCFKAKAKLPSGWKVEKKPSKGDITDLLLIDQKGSPRAAIWMVDKVYDQYARVSIIRPGKEDQDCKVHCVKSKYEAEIHEFKTKYYHLWTKMNYLAPELAPDYENTFVRITDPSRGG